MRNLLSSWKAFLFGVLVGVILSGILVLVLAFRNPVTHIQAIPISASQKSPNLSIDIDTDTSGTDFPLNEGKININTAGSEELIGLPGIGEAKANAIIGYREKYGDFKDIHELLYVPGIGESLFSELKDLISVE